MLADILVFLRHGIADLHLAAPIRDAAGEQRFKIGNVISLGSLRAQIRAILISLVVQGLKRNGLVEIAFGAGQITEEAANAGAVIQKLRIARGERHRLVVGGQRALMIMAETVQGSGGVAHQRILGAQTARRPRPLRTLRRAIPAPSDTGREAT